MNRQPPYFEFSRLASLYEVEKFPPVGAWKWASTFRHEGIRPTVRNPRYLNHIAKPGSLHAPAHREVRLTLSGDSYFTLAGRAYRQQPGSVMFFGQHESRDFRRLDPEEGPFDCLWLHFTSLEFLSFNTHSIDRDGREFRLLPNGAIKSGEASFKIQQVWDQCLQRPHDTLLWESLKSMVASVCLEILGTAQPGRHSFNHHRVIVAIQDYINSHLHENLGLQKLAALAGYSPFFFHRFFLKSTGKTLKQTVNAARLQRAQDLLMENYSVEAVAEAVGFNTASHFSAFFRQHMKHPPGRWRGRQQLAVGRPE